MSVKAVSFTTGAALALGLAVLVGWRALRQPAGQVAAQPGQAERDAGLSGFMGLQAAQVDALRPAGTMSQAYVRSACGSGVCVTVGDFGY